MQFLSFPLWYWDFCANLQIRKEYMFFHLGHGLVLVVSQHARSYLRKFCKKCTMVPWVTVKSWVFVVCFFFNDAPLGNFGSSHQVLNGLETLTYPPPSWGTFEDRWWLPPTFAWTLKLFLGTVTGFPTWLFFLWDSSLGGFLAGKNSLVQRPSGKKSLSSERVYKKKDLNLGICRDH